jgi:hypothetical protein
MTTAMQTIPVHINKNRSYNNLTPKSNKNIGFILKKYVSLLKGMNIHDPYFMKLIYSHLSKAVLLKKDCVVKKTSKQPWVEGDFVGPTVQEDMKQSMFQSYSIESKIEGFTFDIELFTIDPSFDLERFLFFIHVVLALCCKNTLTKTRKFNLKLILSDSEKIKGHAIPDHLNSGYTENYKEIVIYRKEEFLKVFIHECFHMFCLEFSETYTSQYKEMLKSIFKVDSDYLLFESVCEYWARTLNCACVSFFMKTDTTFHEFEKIFVLNLSMETIFSMIQMKNYLSLHNLTYEDILNKTTVPYKEETNGFCYYVITSILMFHYQPTMNWFVNHNETMLNFSKSNKDLYLFHQYIQSIHNSKDFIDALKKLKVFKIENLSMSLFDIEIYG